MSLKLIIQNFSCTHVKRGLEIRIRMRVEAQTQLDIALAYVTRIIGKVKKVCAYNPRSCFIVPDQSCGVFDRV